MKQIVLEKEIKTEMKGEKKYLYTLEAKPSTAF